MLLRRDDAARDSGGIGKPQGPQGGAKACPAGLSLPPRSPESRSLIYWRMPGLSYRPFECGAPNVRRQHFCAINHCVNSQQRKRFHASINQKGGYTPFEANNTNTCSTSQNAEFCSGGGQFKSEYVATLYWKRKPIPPTPLGFPDAFGKFGWMETANFG